MTLVPTSACGTGCLPRQSTLPRVRLLVRVGRVIALIAVVMAGLAVALVVPVLTASRRARAIRGWLRAVVASTGVRLVVTGATAGWPGVGPALVASNHMSWLDIPAILSVQPMRVLAKSEVRGWPVIGLLAARGGTLFIDRNRPRRLPATVAEIARALRGGESVLVFPEGTTWCGRTGGRYYPATMQSAIDANVPVRPVALRYRLADGTPTTVAAFVGDDSMLASAWRIAGTRGLTVEVRLGGRIETADRTRRDVARTVAVRVRAATVRPTPGRVGSQQSQHAELGRRER